MSTIQSFKMMVDHLKGNSIKKTVAVVCGTDDHSQEAVTRAIEADFVKVIMVGPKDKVENYPVFKAYPNSVEFIDISDSDEAARVAVKLVHDKKADILMKGNINTDNLLRVVLNKEYGLLKKGKVLTHLSLAEIPGQSKILFFGDPAVIPAPTIEQRRSMINYMADACRKFGMKTPKIALIHFNEKVNEKFPNSVDYQTLSRESEQGEFGDAIVYGPLDLSTSCNPEGADIKAIKAPIHGDADGLIFPNIETGNVFYKSITVFAHAEIAGLLMGTDCPIVITSRSDSSQTKFNSIALACLTI